MTQIGALFGDSWRDAADGVADRAILDTDPAAVPQADWAFLEAGAAEPNPFLSPWFARPSVDRLAGEGRVRAAVLADPGRSDRPLNGLALFERRRSYYGKPLPHTALWLHDNAFFGTPLVAKGHERAFWSALFDHCDRHLSTGVLLSLPCQAESGPVMDALRGVCAEQGRAWGVVGRTRRALLTGGSDAEERLTQALGTKKRKELRRQRRRLEELGALTVERRRDGDDVGPWIEEFLALEQAGWKGREGSALADGAAKAAMFRETMAGAAAAGALERLALRADGRAIAMLATFIAPPGAFAFKTAFDEELARFSPGVLLQLENLALLDDPAIDWCDSCAAESHPMIDHIWRERREIVTVNIAIGGPLRRAVGSALIRYEASRLAARSKDLPE